MTTKQYALSGVSKLLELGKDGHQVDATNAGYISLLDYDGNLIRVKAANAQASDELVTKYQLDAVHALAGGYLAYAYDPALALSQLATQGTGENGSIRYGDTFKVGGVNASFTLFGLTVESGDLISALVAGADTADETSTNGDWIVIQIRTASDLADGVSTDHSGGKILVKDLGITTDKLAALAVTLEKMADNSVDTRVVIDRAITGPKVAVGTLLDEHHALNQIAKNKMALTVQTTLDKADTSHDTRLPNVASCIGGAFNLDSDSAIAGQSNYLTSTTIVGQLQQADSRIKLNEDDAALRKATVTFDGGVQNIGAPIKAGRALLKVSVTPIVLATGSGCTMSIGVSGAPEKYMKAIEIDLYEGSPNSRTINLPIATDEQIIATVTQGSANAGSFYVTVSHG